MAGNFFVELPVESDAATMADDAITALQALWPTWTPVDSHLEVILIEALAMMAQNAAQVAGKMPAAALRAYGTNVLGLTYLVGTSSTTTINFGLSDSLPHTIPDGTQIIIDGFAFRTVGAFSTAGGGGVGSINGVTVTSVDVGIDKNGLTGANTSGITTPSWVTTIVVVSATTGGTDAEDDTAYVSRLSRTLLLQATTLITLRDFELWALNNPSVGRALAATTAARAITVVLTDLAGNAVSAGVKAAVLASFTGYSEANLTITMVDPVYYIVPVTYVLKMYPGFVAADVIARVNTALSAFFNQLYWGSPPASTGAAPDTWVNEGVVRYTKVVEVIGAVTGVNYVTSVNISAAGVGADFTMASTYPLTIPGVMTGTAS